MNRVFALLMFAAVAGFTACNDDEIGPAPTITLESSQGSNVAGESVAVEINFSAPNGSSSLAVTVNNESTDPISLIGEDSPYTFDFAIPESAQVDEVFVLTFQVFDTEDQGSNIATFQARVSDVAPKPIKEVAAGNYTGNILWSADTIYRVNGFVRIGRDDDPNTPADATGILTIEPGTLIIGDRESKGTLIIQRGSKIIADATAENPIVMTSERAPGLREPGDWGGLVMCGYARNNVPGGVTELEGGYKGYHGGTNDDDDSGILRYVRIEYAGIPINPNEEVNTLTMGSVGRGTTIEYVMASYGLDDAFEWFGGSVDCKYLIAYRGLDDDFDVDLGYNGKVQFGLGIRGASLADQSGSNGFEVDNNGAGGDTELYTSGVFSNITIIGPKANRETAISLQFQHAAQLRRNSKLRIYNSFLTGYPDGLYVDDQRGGSGQHALNDELQVRNTILAGVEHWGGNGYGSAGDVFTGAPSNGAQHPNNPRGRALKQDDVVPGFNITEWFNTPAYRNQLMDKWQDAGIQASIFELGTPNVLPASGSILLDYARWDNTPFKGSGFFDEVSFAGAFGTEDWTEGWAEWDAATVVYY